jgi:hypothetical protein
MHESAGFALLVSVETGLRDGCVGHGDTGLADMGSQDSIRATEY